MEECDAMYIFDELHMLADELTLTEKNKYELEEEIYKRYLDLEKAGYGKVVWCYMYHWGSAEIKVVYSNDKEYLSRLSYIVADEKNWERPYDTDGNEITDIPDDIYILETIDNEMRIPRCLEVKLVMRGEES